MYRWREGYAWRDRSLEERELIARARQGDTAAYEALVVQYQDLAFRAAYLITGDAAAAEDAVQEAFVKAYYALPRFQAGAPLRPWLLRIITNEARNRRKADRRRVALSERVAAGASLERGAERSAEDVALRAERRRMLLRALTQLSDDDRLVIGYRYFLSLSELEMSTALECARGTVKSRLARALKRLRGHLAGVDLEEQSGSPGLRSAPHG